VAKVLVVRHLKLVLGLRLMLVVLVLVLRGKRAVWVHRRWACPIRKGART